MMKRIILIASLISLLFVSQPIICFAQPSSRIFNAGIYELGESKNYIARIKLTNEGDTPHILIFNSNNEQKFSYKFSKTDKSELNVALENNDILVIIGKGDVTIIFEKIQ